MAGLSSLFGYKGGNPLLDYVNSNRSMILGLGAGIAGGGPDFGQAVGRGLQLAGQGQEADQQRELLNYQRQQQDTETNATRAWLQSHYPQYASLPPAEGFQLAMKEMAGGSGQGQLGLTPIWGTDKAGNPVLGQLSNQGGIVPVQMPDGVTFGKEPIRLDAGDRFVLLDPVTRQQIGAIPKNGDIPTGFEQNPAGGIQPMQGSDEQIKRRGNMTAAQTSLTLLEQKQGVVASNIDHALQIAQSVPATGPFSILNAVPGTPQYDLKATLDTIKANIGFDQLQQMRDSSPTGGALGQVSEQENRLLQAVLGSLDQAQSQEQFVANLQFLKQILAQSTDARRRAFAQDFPGVGTSAGTSGGGGGGAGAGAALKQKYGLE